MVAGGHRIIAEDALKLVASLSLSTPTHGHTLVTYTSTDNRTTSTVVDRNRYNHRTTESVGSMKEPTNFLIYTACCCSASNLTFHAYTADQHNFMGTDGLELKMPNGWRTKSLVHKFRLHSRREKGMAESFSRKKLRHAPQKEGG